MIQVREQYGNLYIKILDTYESFDLTLDRLRNIDNLTFNTETSEWITGKESLVDLLLSFDNQIIWVQPLRDIVKNSPVKDAPIVKKHLSYENEHDFKDWPVKPYPYQRVAAHFLAERGRAAIFDGVGLGKTASILAAIQILMNRNKVKRSLIVTLNSLKTQWANEVKKFMNKKAIPVTGPEAKRIRLIKDFMEDKEVEFLIVNYELLRSKKYFDLIKQIPFDAIALDEAQRIKSGVHDKYLNIKPSQNAVACYKLKHIPYRFIATATPIQSRAEEIWSLFHFLDENILGPWESFRERYCKYSLRFGITGSHNLGELHHRIAPYFIRRTKEMPEIQQQLPSVKHDHIFLELTEAQEKIQAHILNKIEEVREQALNIKGNVIINGQLLSPEEAKEYYDGVQQGLRTFLVENANTPELLAHPEASPMSHSIIRELGLSENEIKKSPKLDYLKNFINQLFYDEPNSKVVIFTEFERMARILHEHLPRSVIYTGQISEYEKTKSVQLFREDPNVKIFISTRAGSTGLNLQCANYLIHFDLPYVYTEIEQRNGRIDRTGNPFPNINIHYYIMNDSYDEDLLALLERKSNIATTILTGEGNHLRASDDVSAMALRRLMKRKGLSK